MTLMSKVSIAETKHTKHIRFSKCHYPRTVTIAQTDLGDSLWHCVSFGTGNTILCSTCNYISMYKFGIFLSRHYFCCDRFIQAYTITHARNPHSHILFTHATKPPCYLVANRPIIWLQQHEPCKTDCIVVVWLSPSGSQWGIPHTSSNHLAHGVITGSLNTMDSSHVLRLDTCGFFIIIINTACIASSQTNGTLRQTNSWNWAGVGLVSTSMGDVLGTLNCCWKWCWWEAR